LLFEALVLMLTRQMPFAAVARTVGENWHRAHAICRRYVDLAVAPADLSATSSVIIDETSYRRGHSDLTLVADADAREVVFVHRGADNIAGFAQHLRAQNAAADNITAACIDMSPAVIKGVTKHQPKAAITFDKFDVVAHASEAVDKMRRSEPKTDPALKGARCALRKDRSKLSSDQARDLDRPVAQFTPKRTARAWLHREQLRDILERRQFNIVSTMLAQWCTNP
jgi:transposase